MAQSSTTVHFLIISDTHGHDFFGDDDGQRDPHWTRESTPAADVVLHCGDLTNMGSIPNHVATLTMLSTFRAELKLVIAGNHDISLDGKASQRSPEMLQTHHKALKMWTNSKARKAGIHYLTEGFHTFTLKNDVTFFVFASPCTPDFNNWAFGYAHGEDRWQPLRKARDEGRGCPDIVMTHGPPVGYLDVAHDKHLGCPHLLSAIAEARPRIHCFGHIHEASGAQDLLWDYKKSRRCYSSSETPIEVPLSGTQSTEAGSSRTRMVNAAVVDSANRPAKVSPWLVNVEFPVHSPQAQFTLSKRKSDPSGGKRVISALSRSQVVLVLRRSEVCFARNTLFRGTLQASASPDRLPSRVIAVPKYRYKLFGARAFTVNINSLRAQRPVPTYHNIPQVRLQLSQLNQRF